MGISELAIAIVVLGLLFDYTNGFHDAANVVSTMIATKALAPTAAIVLAGVLNTIGAMQISGVARTIATGIIHIETATQEVVVFALIGAILWNFLTWYFSIPSSSSYALIGGLMGVALIKEGWSVVHWQRVTEKIFLPMVISPIAGFVIAYSLMKTLSLFAASHKAPENMYRYCQIGSGSLVALAHGLNDAQKSMGIITLGLFASGWIESPAIPVWVILACALTIGIGTATGGWRIINTVGFKITRLSPVQGFAAQISASTIILMVSVWGMPVSSSQMIVGSVGGAGAAEGRQTVCWPLATKMIWTWVLTLPGAGVLSAVAWCVGKWIFS